MRNDGECGKWNAAAIHGERIANRPMPREADDTLPKPPPHAVIGRALAGLVVVLAIGFMSSAVGFVGFLSQLRGAEIKPERRADGIVVLTGGSSRVSDAMDLLAGGYGRRLLISGVHPTNDANDISRSVPESKSLISCCVDLDYSAINTRSN